MMTPIKANLVSIGDSFAPELAFPTLSNAAIVELLQAACYRREYSKGPDGQYGPVWVRTSLSLRFDDVDVFTGTAEDYRNLPPIEQQVTPEPPAED
jgi:hypothetical protein